MARESTHRDIYSCVVQHIHQLDHSNFGNYTPASGSCDIGFKTKSAAADATLA